MVESIVLGNWCKRLAASLVVIPLCGCDTVIQHSADFELRGDYKAIANCATQYLPSKYWLREDHDDVKQVRFLSSPPGKSHIEVVGSGAGRTHVSVSEWSLGNGMSELYRSYFIHCESTIAG
ncbi:hypothetical protein HFO98_05900 [Rhizobium leguminosarum]|uniref:hypothetical protein n=1 Tax=Rhizobium leguminosarum TaxID=384 RepID=UPI001C952FC3|nr:hypothetical protein [Rhizobium leguminosarum]MBY5359126.1 hypothetical protein [Rhizobium leguminosarum]MBY5408015.1 hypothetical protein [Rhizobium leguminosarum]